MFQENYARHYDLFNHDKPYKKEIEFVYSWAGKPKSIFDIGAGTGSYWKYYPKGTIIFGVDKSKDMVWQSKDVVQADITKYVYTKERFDCATALFDVLNYIPKHDWWKNIPLKKGGYFIFDVWDKDKVNKDGFKKTTKVVNGITRTIYPIEGTNDSVDLNVVFGGSDQIFNELHKMYFYSMDDIKKFCGNDFEIVEVKPTKTWQVWYKCRRK